MSAVSPDRQRRGIYVTLDSILDTRLATLHRFWPDKVNDLLLSGKYHDRVNDVFDDIDPEEFKKRYEERDGETLRYAVRTFIPSLIKDAVRILQMEVINEPFRNMPKVFLNMYPYNTDEEFNTAFGDILMAQITEKGLVGIEVFNKKPNQITTQWVNKHISIMFDYELLQWMEIQTKNFEQLTIAHVRAHPPALDLTLKQTKESLDELTEETGIHPFADIQNTATPLLDLKYIPPKYYSIVDIRDFKTA